MTHKCRSLFSRPSQDVGSEKGRRGGCSSSKPLPQTTLLNWEGVFPVPSPQSPDVTFTLGEDWEGLD